MFVHIARAEDWEAAQASGQYAPPELEEHGYIGCAMPKQVEAVANEQFAGRDDLVLLWIQPTRLKPVVIYERPHGAEVGELYPHVRAAINLDAVVEARKLPPWEPGRFVLPPQPPDRG
ncbi:MAG TPA: DUF952 domain-containing protein [Gaiellaceae bacterium]|jgi:uncharacterized protein (DUF952 family)|nr:DUF952 domain-containing protein [Gaiellaceae bacterium]